MPKLKHTTACIASVTDADLINSIIEKFSDLNKICRIIAYCCRWIGKRVPGAGGFDRGISHEEITAPLKTLCAAVQRKVFSIEYNLLSKGQKISSSSSLASLVPFMDDGTIRVGGRLRNSLLPYGTRHQIVLPKGHRLTKLIIEMEHRRSLHSGLQSTMATIRQRFWPLSLRSTARRVIGRCIVCFRNRPTASEAQMGDLSSPRVVPSRPFSRCGVDYAGPIIIREGKRRNARNSKAYICVFVCMVTKAIHLEVVSDLTSGAFLASLK